MLVSRLSNLTGILRQAIAASGTKPLIHTRNIATTRGKLEIRTFRGSRVSGGVGLLRTADQSYQGATTSIFIKLHRPTVRIIVDRQRIMCVQIAIPPLAHVLSLSLKCLLMIINGIQVFGQAEGPWPEW